MSARELVPFDPARQSVVATTDTPFAAPVPTVWTPGTAIAATEPANGLHVCRLNGQWLSRQHWDWELVEGDVVEWFEVPCGRNGWRTVLQLAVAVAAIYFPGAWGLTGWQAAAASVAISVGGNLAVNALLPVQMQGQGEGGVAPSPTYNTSLNGNVARLYAPIPKVMGTHLFYPPFGAQPYFEFEANEQYYRALFCIGVGQHTIVRSLIDDTDINRFADVLVARYLPPGTLPSDVQANVVTAPEVAGGELKSGTYIGGFAASGPRSTCTHIGIDVVAPRGLSNLSVTWRVEARAIDDFGSPLAAWATLATETRTANTNTAQRWSSRYAISPAARVEVRVVRTDAKNEDPGVAHEIQWVGLRGYLAQPAPLNPNAAHFELVMRASEQLSGLAQRRFAVLAAAHCRTWSPSTGWSAPAPNRNPFWWLADLWSSTTWGQKLPDDRIDLPTLRALALQADARQDRFDYVLDSTMDSWEFAQLVARAGRARVFRRGPVYTVARDEAADLPVTAFTSRNCLPQSMTMSETLRSVDSPDGLIVEYFDNRAWDWRELPVEPMPGVVEVTRPVVVRLPGVTGLTHARREAKYEAAAMFWRRRSVGCVTEMEGMLPAYLDAVLWQPDLPTYGATGDVVTAAGSVLTLSEPVPENTTVIALTRPNGTVWGPVACTVLAANQVQVGTAPDFTLSVAGTTRERTRFLAGSTTSVGQAAEVVRIAAISDGGRRDGVQYWRIDASIDDARVHTADVALLPSPGVEQDPIDTGVVTPGGGGGSGGLIVDLRGAEYWDLQDTRTPAGAGITLELRNNGRLALVYAVGVESVEPGQWTPAAPITSAAAGNFEVRATLVAGDPLTSGTLDTWESLATTRSWSRIQSTVGSGWSLIRFEIRDQNGVLQDQADIRLTATLLFWDAP